MKKETLKDIATEYATDIVSGKISACWQVVSACKRHLNLLNEVREGKRKDIRYNLKNLQSVLKYFSFLKHFKTHIGQSFIPESWQVFILANLYAWEKWSEEGKRWVYKHTDNFIEVAKKNGKSTLISGCAGYDCLAGEPTGAEVYIGAATEEQAKIIWNTVKAFIERNEELSKSYTVIGNTIYANGTNRTSFIKPFGRDSKKEGLNPYRVYIDELHDHPDAEVYTTLSDGMVARQKRGCTVITTAGNDPYSFCKKQQDRYEQVLKGVFDADNVFAIIYTAPSEANIENVETWELANPALRTVKSLEAMQEDYTKSLQSDMLSVFRYKNLCQWTDDKESWIDIQKWQELKKENVIQQGMYCYAGLDLAQVNDLASLVLVFPKQEGLKYPYILPYFFIPKKTATVKQLTDKIPFQKWEQDGYIFISDDDIIRLSSVADFILQCNSKYPIKNLFFDRAMSREVEYILKENNIPAEPSFQGFALSKDIKKTEELIYAKEIFHNGNPCMTWNISNTATKINDKQEKMLIKTSGYRKIDGSISLVEAIGAMTVGELGLKNKPTRTNFSFRHTV